MDRNRSRWIAAWAVMCLSSTLAWGQTPQNRTTPEPATPAPATASSSVPSTARKAAPLTLFPGLQPGSLNVSKLNDAMRKILDPLAQREPAIERLYLTFDPEKTNIAADSIGVAAGAELNNTVWSAAPSRLNFTFSAKYVPPRGGPANAIAEADGIWQTDMVAMASHLVPILATRLGQPPKPSLMDRLQGVKPVAATSGTLASRPGEPPLIDPQAEFVKRVVAELSAAGPIRTFDDLCDLITKASSHRFVVQAEYITSLRRALEVATDPARRDELAQLLLDARIQRDRQLQVRPQVVRSADGKAELLSISILDAVMSDQLTVDRLELRVTPVDIRLVAAVRVTRGVEMYALMKPVAAAVLGQLQEGRPEDIDSYRRIIENYFLQDRDLVLGPLAKP